MSLLSLILMSVAWSGVLWFGATLLCTLSPAPKTAQLIWRLAAFLMPAPLLLSLVVPGLPQAYGGDLPILPLLEPAIVTPGAADLADPSPGLKLPPLQHMLIGLLIFGWAARGLLWMRGQARLQAVKRRAKPSMLDAVNWAVALGLPDEPEVRLIARESAFVAGLKAPVIYVPEGLVGTADVQQILAHECVHLRRGDLVTRPIERGMADLFWFSPFVWAMRERLDYWREAVTDEAAAALTGDRVAYARALTTAARFARPLTPMPVAAFILPRQGTLKMRLTHLLKPAPRRPRRLAIAGLFAALVALPMAIAQGVAIKGDALPKAPAYTHAVLDKAKLTSAFGPRIHPISKERHLHRGVDLAEEIGKPVYAPADGTVMFAGEKGAYGNLIALRVAADTILRFAQLDSMNVEAGETVKAGQIVGTLGASGAATGPHLHLEVWRGETSFDPEKEPGLVLATVLREMKTAQAEGSGGASGPAKFSIPEGCAAYENWFNNTPLPDAWGTRAAQAKAANAARGLSKSGKSFNPEILVNPSPSYPQAAAAARTTGACMVMFDLSEDGLVREVQAACSDPVFETSAVEGVKVAQFSPVMSGGEVVKVRGIIYPLLYCLE